MLKSKLKRYYPLAILFAIYIIFYFQYIFGGYMNSSGDVISLHYPSIYYLKETILSGKFPFYTERIFSGFPIYENSEVAYLNIIRILLAILFSPANVLKIEHFIFFAAGTLGWYFLTKKFNFSNLAIIVSHSIFFYSVQNVARFGHINLIYVYFLIPLCFYFFEKFFESKKVKWLIFLSLANAVGIYYGNYNGVAISVIAQSIYVICGIKSLREIPLIIKTGIILGIWIISLSITSLFPSYMLYLGSHRKNESITFTEGSVHSTYLLSNLVYPYPLGFGSEFKGNAIKNQWLIHEISIYPGIAALAIGIIGFFTLKDKKLLTFFYTNFLLFIFFACMEYIPGNKAFNFIPVNLFRYWIRYGVVFHLSLALIVGKWLSEPTIKFKIKTRFPAMILIFLILFIIFWLNKDKSTLNAIHKYFVSAFPHGFPFIKQVAGIFISVILLAGIFLKTKQKILLYILSAIIVFDVTYFSHMALNTNLTPAFNLKDEKTTQATQQAVNQRVTYMNPKIKGNTPLYYPSWGLFGYAVSYEQQNYGKLLALYGLDSRRFKLSDTSLLQEFGLAKIIHEDSSVQSFENRPLELVQANYSDGYYIKRAEGDVSFKINLQQSQYVNIFIRNFPGWKLRVNGQEKSFTGSKDDVYLNFLLEKGENTVELKYYPIHFYIGTVLGLILIPLTFYVISKRFNSWVG